LATHEIKYAADTDRKLWDSYVRQHPDASVFHLFGWRNVIHATYGHKTHYLMLTRREGGGRVGAQGAKSTVQKILGVLPVVHLKHAFFGNRLVSMPFLDGGGILADSREVEESLLSEVVALGRKIGASSIELRHERLLDSGRCHRHWGFVTSR